MQAVKSEKLFQHFFFVGVKEKKRCGNGNRNFSSHKQDSWLEKQGKVVAIMECIYEYEVAVKKIVRILKWKQCLKGLTKGFKQKSRLLCLNRVQIESSTF